MATPEVRAFLLLAFTEQRKAVVKEVSFCLYRTFLPHIPSPNHVNVELYGLDKHHIIFVYNLPMDKVVFIYPYLFDKSNVKNKSL
jgi:hypothetical protein